MEATQTAWICMFGLIVVAVVLLMWLTAMTSELGIRLRKLQADITAANLKLERLPRIIGAATVELAHMVADNIQSVLDQPAQLIVNPTEIQQFRNEVLAVSTGLVHDPEPIADEDLPEGIKLVYVSKPGAVEAPAPE